MNVGARIGPYEVIAKLGEGGMGEVYRARDARLQRDVAIKILPAGVANDPDRLARFTREAQVLASLNHPHVAHVYGIEEHGDTRGLVMELVEGPTLADRLAPGPLSVDEALPIARQIADALDAAHARGIVHRDLKPANIKITPQGVVKVLDFGLAKALEGSGLSAVAPSGAKAANSPTFTSPAMTAAGMILGTAAYMSPEQARGKTVDQRADIWAFGVVLYEMLTGRCPFAAETVSDTIAAVLTCEPDLTRLPPTTPPAVRHVIERCVRKDPARRLHHIADARIELDDVSSGAAGATTAPIGPAPVRLPVAIAALVIAAVLGAFAGWRLSPRATPPPLRSFTIPIAGFSTVSHTAISRDGRWIAYSPNKNAAPFPLLVRSLDTYEAREVAAAQNSPLNPFFSPDAKWLAFFNDNALYKVPITGGGPERVTSTAAGIAHGVWDSDDTIVLSANFAVRNAPRRLLARVPAKGGEATFIAIPNADESYLSPDLLPDGTILATLATPKSSSIVAFAREGGARRVIMADARSPRYSKSGHLVFQRVSTGDLLAIVFDASTLQPTGDPVRLASAAFLIEATAFAVADDGTLIYSAPDEAAEQAGFTIVAVDHAGAITPVMAEPGLWAQPRIAPDGRSVLYRSIAVPNCDFWSVDLVRGTRSRVTSEGDNHDPVWRSDGVLAWDRVLTTTRGILTARPGQMQHAVSIANAADVRVPLSWSADGSLLFEELNQQTGLDLWMVSKTGEAAPWLRTRFNETQARFSRNDQWIAFVSNESGRDEVYLQPRSGDGGRILVSVNGGNGPLFSPDGRTLYYAERTQLMAVEIDFKQSPPDISRPRKLFGGPFVWDRPSNYDISPDGKRFFFVQRPDGEQHATLRVILNWQRMLPQ